MKIKNIIESEKIIFKPLLKSDQPLLLKWLTNQTVLEFWEGKSAIFDLNRIKQDFYDKNNQIIRTIIIYQGVPIGYCQMYIVDKQTAKEYDYKLNKKIVYGVDQFIGEPEFWGKGIGTNFMKLVVEYLFNHKGADAVILDPHTNNQRAIRCYQKVGFDVIKLLPQHELHDGEMVDCYLMECKKN